jgi:DUF438 domain-containing protein
MELSENTKVHDLLSAYPFLEEFLPAYDPKFRLLGSQAARATIGRVATLSAAAGIAGVEPRALLAALADEVERRTGARPELASATGAGGDQASSPRESTPRRPGGTTTPPTAMTRAQRLETLKAIIHDLHGGGDLASARTRFAEAVGDVEASEIATLEEELIRGGLPVADVQRLCDVHVGAFRHALDEHAGVQAPPGHPVHTYLAANRIITELANRLGSLAQAGPILEQLAGIENHYQHKENQLFPLLERHGVTGPTQVMWGVHDQIRAALKAAREAARRQDSRAFAAAAPALARDLVEMVYKEEKILLPMAMETLSEEEWAEVRRGEDVLGYALAQPAAPWPVGSAARAVATGATDAARPLDLATGALTLEQVNLMLTHLPVDISFVDETDTVRYYSEGRERIFPRSPGVIGRRVQKCHPPKSVHTVEAILAAFRAGTKDVAEFWIEMQGRFIHIRYYAMRDGAGAYRGCLEVSQDVTAIRALQGERRLLDWE